MRNIAVTIKMNDVPTKLNLRKLPRQRRFQARINGQTTEFIIADETNQVEYYEGVELSEAVNSIIRGLIHQYFSGCRAIQKIGEDNYEDYDDY
jgi:hypothetical protein